ncbi:response regulator transcription factor [Amnibacterium setariae]|uniref:DNA-binding response regulator n=1 Tax=Amnibacterium setariae TaxID=2306585 RepID=A0A3A1TZQ4_9MICO|nr:response regulator [Amnibacterium setariae]RIX26510.1 DNA-binding response regulator [Amnibacterium setariae]
MPVDDDLPPVPTVIGGSARLPRTAPPAARPSPQRAVRLALLDDHEVLLDSMASWLRSNAPDFDVTLTATSWLELVHSPAFPTDLVLIDVQLREPVSIEARVRTCRAAGARVIVLTGLDTPDLRERALRAGAAGFIGKSRPLADVLAVAREVMGLTAEHPVQRDWRPLPRAAEQLQRPRLSLGEEAALRLYASGRSTNEVAAEMHVQFETAKTYLRRVREKYARVSRPASRKAELIQRATEDGYI